MGGRGRSEDGELYIQEKGGKVGGEGREVKILQG